MMHSKDLTQQESQISQKCDRKIRSDNGQKFDLVFCGKEATDAALGQGGLMLAEELDEQV